MPEITIHTTINRYIPPDQPKPALVTLVDHRTGEVIGQKQTGDDAVARFTTPNDVARLTVVVEDDPKKNFITRKMGFKVIPNRTNEVPIKVNMRSTVGSAFFFTLARLVRDVDVRTPPSAGAATSGFGGIDI